MSLGLVKATRKPLYCSFCGKEQGEVGYLVAGPTVFICNECVELCREVGTEMLTHTVTKLPPAAEIPRQEIEAQNIAFRKAILAYLSEFDNPVPDAIYRKTLRDHLRKLVGAPDQPRRS